MNDPFAAPPADEAQSPLGSNDLAESPTPSVFDTPPAPAPAKAPAKKAAAKPALKSVSVETTGDGKVVVTLKGGSGFDAPWIVIHAEDLDDAFEQVSGDNATTLVNLMERVQKAAQHFAGLAPSATASGGGGRPQRQAAPQAAQEAPGGEKRFCEHGEMRFRSGVSKAGKPYQAFFCASGDRNNECKAQFLR